MTTRIRPRKDLGQHWLADSRALARISKAADIQPDDTVIEVGPGKGALTRFLAPRARRLILVEVDSVLTAGLREKYADADNVHVIEGDILDLPITEILNQGGGGLPYVVLGNLPYFIGSAIIRKFLASATPPRQLVVTLQAEVAERIAAKPGKMSYLSVEMQLMAEARLLFRIPPSAFRPPPKVKSAVLRLDVRDSPDVEVDDRERFLELARAGFAAPRKQLRNSLSVGLRLDGPAAEALITLAKIDPSTRPQTLDLDDWRRLYFTYSQSRAKST